jgi:hypothetical protein
MIIKERANQKGISGVAREDQKSKNGSLMRKESTRFP